MYSPGRPRTVTAWEERAIIRAASNSSLSAEKAGVKTNVRNVQTILQKCKHIKRKKLQRKPPLTQKHKAERVEWRQVLFTDEKKFNLDRPDGWSYYYHYLRKDEQILSRRQHGGGSVMILAGIGYYGKTEIKFVPTPCLLG